MSSIQDAYRFVRRSLARAGRDEHGAAAVEFGLVAFPFFLILFMIIEVSMAFFANQILDKAVGDAARLIRTGQAQAQGFSATEFRDTVCSGLVGLFDCGDRLHIDVKTFTNFNSIAIDDPISDEGEVEDNFGYDDGGPETIVVARVYYEWPLVTSYLHTGFGNLGNGDRLIGSVVTFRNEPFPQ
jgi:Flp pilus assembly protein TadG